VFPLKHTIWEYRYVYIDPTNSNFPNSNNKFRYIPMNLYIPYIYTIWVWWKMSHDLKSNSLNIPKLNGFGQVSWRNPWSSACFRPLGPLPPRPLVVASQGRSGCSLRRLDFWTSGWKFGKKMGKQKGKNGPKWGHKQKTWRFFCSQHLWVQTCWTIGKENNRDSSIQKSFSLWLPDFDSYHLISIRDNALKLFWNSTLEVTLW